ncbi:hypothetical protein [Algoriphagus jejuensis]|uniref:hypothetical protein n=1 Tax=Algoriphagus jejuensis TaxID=419934 RepID=UPI0031E304AE
MEALLFPPFFIGSSLKSRHISAIARAGFLGLAHQSTTHIRHVDGTKRVKIGIENQEVLNPFFLPYAKINHHEKGASFGAFV